MIRAIASVAMASWLVSPVAAQWRTQVAKATAPCPNTIYGAGVRLCSATGLQRQPFGLLSIAGPVTVRNDTARRVADIVIECRGVAHSGTHVGTTRHVLYVGVAPGAALNVPGGITLGYMHQQAVTAYCDVTGYRN